MRDGGEGIVMMVASRAEVGQPVAQAPDGQLSAEEARREAGELRHHFLLRPMPLRASFPIRCHGRIIAWGQARAEVRTCAHGRLCAGAGMR